MKRFLFPLASALRIRKMQAEVEEMKLFRLTAELGDCQRQLNDIGIAARERPEALTNFGYITGPELVEIDSRSVFLKKEKIKILAREAELLHRITAAKGLIREATQRVELLETLQTKARKEWQITADKELQTLAEESYNSLQGRLSADDADQRR